MLGNVESTKSLKSLGDLGVRIIPPRQANGKHNIPDTEVLTAEVIRVVEQQIGDHMPESNNDTTRPRVDVRIEAAKAPKLAVGTVWKVVASSPVSLWEGAYAVRLERTQTEEHER